MLEGDDGGATVSTDGGKSWSSELNQPTGQFYHVAIDEQFPFHVYGASQDEGAYEGPTATQSASSRRAIGIRSPRAKARSSRPSPAIPT